VAPSFKRAKVRRKTVDLGARATPFVQLLGQQYVGLAQLRHLEGPRQKNR